MKILLATDGTKHSEAASEMIRNLNLSEVSELKLISIVDMAVPLTIDMYEGYIPSTMEIEATAKENANIYLERTKTQLEKIAPNLLISSEVLFGSPEIRIVEKAVEMEADLIIVGSHGYNRWERLLLGSVSDSVIRHAPCSVLVVRS